MIIKKKKKTELCFRKDTFLFVKLDTFLIYSLCLVQKTKFFVCNVTLNIRIHVLYKFLKPVKPEFHEKPKKPPSSQIRVFFSLLGLLTKLLVLYPQTTPITDKKLWVSNTSSHWIQKLTDKAYREQLWKEARPVMRLHPTLYGPSLTLYAVVGLLGLLLGSSHVGHKMLMLSGSQLKLRMHQGQPRSLIFLHLSLESFSSSYSSLSKSIPNSEDNIGGARVGISVKLLLL